MDILKLAEEKFKIVKIKGYDFKIKFISPLNMVEVTRRRIVLQGGNPVGCLTDSDFMLFENIAIVNVCVEELPPNFPYDQSESCIKWDDLELIEELANSIRQHTLDIEARLKKNRPMEGSIKE
jgi:hypothetical protein